jgi:hypothetical protein
MTRAPWPGTARKPEPRPPEHAAPPGAAWRGIVENLAGLAGALLALGVALWLVSHVGSAPR